MRHAAQHTSFDALGGRHARPTSTTTTALVDAPTTVLPVVPTPRRNPALDHARDAVTRGVPFRRVAEGTWLRMSEPARAGALAAVGLGVAGLLGMATPPHAPHSTTSASTSTTMSTTSTTSVSRSEQCAQSANRALDTTAVTMSQSPSSQWVADVALGQELVTDQYGTESAEVHAYRAGAYDLLQWMYSPDPTAAGFEAMVSDRAVPDVQAMCNQYT